MNAMTRTRTVATWIMLGAALLNAIVSARMLELLRSSVGPRLERLGSGVLPAFSSVLLRNFDTLTTGLYGASVAVLIAAAAAMHYSATRDAAHHTISLVTSALYHLVVFAWIAAVMGLVLFPNLMGI